jgi:UDP-glucose 4-epimerase
MVIPRFVAQALAGDPITVYGDGTQTRCFAHVGDVVDALIKLFDHREAPGQVFNIGNDEEVTILDLARRVQALTGSKSPIRLVPYGEAYTAGFEDMQRRVPDLGKIRRLIGYRPTRNLDRILADVMKSFTAESTERGRDLRSQI